MWKKSVMCLVMILLCAGFAVAVNYTWTGAGADNLWNKAENWTPAGGPPTSLYGGGASNDNAMINNITDPNLYPRIDSTIPLQHTYGFYLGNVAGTVGSPAVMAVNIENGQLYGSYKAFFSAKAYTNGTLNVSGSSSVVFAGETDIATTATSVGTVNLNGGEIKTGNLIIARGVRHGEYLWRLYAWQYGDNGDCIPGTVDTHGSSSESRN